jgi:deoxyribonuclease-4
MRIGAQVPMAGGLLCALEYAVSTGCETMQIFSKSPRRWEAPPLDPQVCDRFREEVAAAGMGPVFCHGSYLINVGAEDDALWERSIVALADELIRARQVGASGVVLHLGRRFSDDEDECIGRVVSAVRRASSLAGANVPPLLLENSAGAGRQFGVTVPEMLSVLIAVQTAGVWSGLCIDTCHAFAAGIDVRTAVDWSELMTTLRRLAGKQPVALIHANDCKWELASHKDRHEWIGAGQIGSEGFGAMVAEPSLADVSIVVEMPGEGPFKDEENVRRLKSMRADAAESGDPGRESV